MLFLADAGCGAEKSHEPPLVNRSVARSVHGDADAVAVAPAPAGVSSHSPSSPPPSPFPPLLPRARMAVSYKHQALPTSP